MKPTQSEAEECKARIMRLKVEYAANGAEALEAMSSAEKLLLLSEKQLQLGVVSLRCELRQGLHVNVPLKVMLEDEVTEISTAIHADREQAQDRDRGPGRGR